MEGEKRIKSESEAGWELGSLRVSVGKRERDVEGKQSQVLALLISFELLFGLLPLMSFWPEINRSVAHASVTLAANASVVVSVAAHVSASVSVNL